MADSTQPTSLTGAFQVTVPGRQVAKPASDAFSQDTFLKLLSAQMKSQNPLEPMKDTEFLAQMAQFQTFEQITRLNTGMAALNHSGQMERGASLIGKTVTYQAGDGTTSSGTVERVTVDPADGGVNLVVGGTTIAIEQVSAIGGTP